MLSEIYNLNNYGIDLQIRYIDEGQQIILKNTKKRI